MTPQRPERPRLEVRLRRAQATIDGLLVALATLRRRVAEVQRENEQLTERLLRHEAAAESPWAGHPAGGRR